MIEKAVEEKDCSSKYMTLIDSFINLDPYRRAIRKFKGWRKHWQMNLKVGDVIYIEETKKIGRILGFDINTHQGICYGIDLNRRHNIPQWVSPLEIRKATKQEKFIFVMGLQEDEQDTLERAAKAYMATPGLGASVNMSSR